LLLRRLAQRKSLDLPFQRFIPFSLRVKVVRVLFSLQEPRCSLIRARTVSGSEVRMDSVVGWPGSASVRSLPHASVASWKDNPPDALQVAVLYGGDPICVA